MTPMTERSSPFDTSAVRPSSAIFSTTASTWAGDAWWDMTMINSEQLLRLAVEVGSDRLRPTQVGGPHLGLGSVGVVEEKDTDAPRDRARIRPRHHHVVAAEQRHRGPAHPPGGQGRELGVEVERGGEVGEADLLAVELV